MPLVYQLETQMVSHQSFTDLLKNTSVTPSNMKIGLSKHKAFRKLQKKLKSGVEGGQF